MYKFFLNRDIRYHKKKFISLNGIFTYTVESYGFIISDFKFPDNFSFRDSGFSWA